LQRDNKRKRKWVIKGGEQLREDSQQRGLPKRNLALAEKGRLKKKEKGTLKGKIGEANRVEKGRRSNLSARTAPRSKSEKRSEKKKQGNLQQTREIQRGNSPSRWVGDRNSITEGGSLRNTSAKTRLLGGGKKYIAKEKKHKKGTNGDSLGARGGRGLSRSKGLGKVVGRLSSQKISQTST